MPTSCPPTGRCGTNAPGWMNGGHPTVADGQISRQVCFHWNSNCCLWSTNIKVRNCGSYYVYYLHSTTNNGYCSLRYCGTNWKQGTSKVLHILPFHLTRLHCIKERIKTEKKEKLHLTSISELFFNLKELCHEIQPN